MSQTRALVLMEELPRSPIKNLQYPLGIPKTDDSSVRDTIAKVVQKLAQAALKYERDGWVYDGEIEWSVNPTKTAIVGVRNLKRLD
jgi:uncharacterized protein YqgV (UPF0045/DUF77 family)